MFVIKDEDHAEWIGHYHRRDDALAELRRLAGLPWDDTPNRAPCTSWRTCGRRYDLIEFDTSSEPWRMLGIEAALQVSATATKWLFETVAPD